jgi:autotransporter-associated beta strand protein
LDRSHANLATNASFETQDSGGFDSDPAGWTHWDQVYRKDWAEDGTDGGGWGMAFEGWYGCGGCGGFFHDISTNRSDTSTNLVYYFHIRQKVESNFTDRDFEQKIEFLDTSYGMLHAVTSIRPSSAWADNVFTTITMSADAPSSYSRVRVVWATGSGAVGGSDPRSAMADLAQVWNKTKTYRPSEIVDEFAYGPLFDALTGQSRGSGFTNNWSESTAGSYVASEGSFANMTGYPVVRGNKVLVTPPNDSGRFAYRAIPGISTGSIYVAYMMNFQFDGANKYAGISFMNEGTEELFFGELYGQDNVNNLGLTVTGVGDSTSSYTLNNGTGEDYLIIGHFNFNTRSVRVIAYYKTDTVPSTEPASWSASNTISVGTVPRIDGIRLGAGAGAGAGTPGNVYYDEVRVARSWKELLNQPVETTWDGGGDNNSWGNATNWVGNVVPASSDVVTFYDSIHNGTNIDLGGNRTVEGLRFNASADTALNFINNTVTINGGGVAVHSGAAGNHVIASAVSLGANQAWTNESTADLVVSGVISGTGTLAKEGNADGRVVLSGANTFSGALAINNGRILITHSNALGSTAAGTTVASGPGLQIQGGITTAVEALNISGNGYWGGGVLENVSGNNTFAGPVTLGLHVRLRSQAGTMTLNSGSAIGGSGWNIEGAGDGSIYIDSVVGTGTGGINKIDAGELRLNNTANTFSGYISVSGGILRVGNDGTLGATPGAPRADSIRLDNGTLTTTNGTGWTLYANRGIGLGHLGGTVSNVGGTVAYNGIVAGNGSLTKAGSGSLILGGNNTYTGRTILAGGTLSISADTRLGTAPAAATPGQLTFNGGQLTASAGFTLNANRGIAMTGNGTFQVSGNVAYSGAITGGGTLTKTGANTLTLHGISSHSGGTIISVGALIQNGTNSSSAFSISSGATMIGTGAVNSVAISGELDAGNAANAVGVIRAVSATLSASGTNRIDMSNATGTAGSGWDLLRVDGGGGVVTVSSSAGNPFVIRLDSMGGTPTGWDNTASWSWMIMDAGTLSGFSADKFTVDTTDFSPALGGGTFSVSDSSGNLMLNFTPAAAADIAAAGTNGTTIADGSATPQLGNGTDFGDVAVNGGTKTHTFSILSSGTSPLFVDTVAIGGANATNFTVLTQPDSWVASNKIEVNADFETGATGWNGPGANHQFKGEYYNLYPKRGTNYLTMWANELCYRQMPVTGNSNYTLSLWIASPTNDGLAGDVHGEIKLEWTDNAGTDLGSALNISFATNGGAYTINNLPSGRWYNYVTNLTAPALATSGRVVLVVWNWGTGGGRAAFDHLQFFQQQGSVQTQTFSVRFDPSAVGTHSATVYITNNVAAKSPYDFVIRGTGTWPGIHVSPSAFTTNTMVGVSPGDFTFGVTNVGNGTLSYAVSTGYSFGASGWATNNPGAGSLGPAAGQQHTVKFGTVDLPAGTYYVTNTFTDANASNSPRTLVITLNVTNQTNPDAIYDGFGASSGDLNGGTGGTGWSNAWSEASGFADYASGSFPTGVVSCIDVTGNKVVFWADVDGRWISADRTFNRPVTSGRFYFSWMQNYAFNGANKWAGLSLMDGTTEKAFIGKVFDADKALGIDSSSDDRTSITNMENGVGNDYFISGMYDFSTRELSATFYKIASGTNGEMIAEQPQGYWYVTTTQSVGHITRISGFRLTAGANGALQVGAVYYDEVRGGTNWFEVNRNQGQQYPDQMADGPRPHLIFLGTNYTVGASNDATITDAQLANTSDKLDFAILWTNTYGIFLTNRNGRFNIGSRAGRITPNWDPITKTGSGQTNALNLDTNFTGFVGANGAVAVTTYVQNAFNITTSAVGDSYFVTVSAENDNTNGGFLLAPNTNDAVPIRRALTVNSQLVFTVTDDDVVDPVLVKPALGLRIGSSEIGNLLSDPGFDIGVGSPWTTFSLTSAVISNGIGEGGGAGVLMTIGFGTNNYGGFFQDYTIRETVSRRYLFAIRAKDGSDHFNCAQLIMKLEFFDSDNNLIYAASNDIVNQVTSPTEWRTYTLSATSTPGTVRIRPSLNFDTAGGFVGTLGRSNMWDNAKLYWATEAETNPVLRVTDGQLSGASSANPFHVTLNAYDAYSGLSRGTNSTATQSFISVQNLTTNNVTNYNPGTSTALATNDGSVSAWTWSNGFSSAAVQTFMGAGSNIVVSTIRDADSDRTDDQLSLSNRTAGYFIVVDDDTNYPLKGFTRTTELLINPGFETNGVGWTNWYDPGNSFAEFSAAAAESGSYGYAITNRGWVAYAAQFVPVTPGASYVLSVRAKKAGVVSLSGFYVKAEFYNNAGYMFDFRETNIFNSLTTDWQTFTRPVTQPAGVLSNKIVLLYYSSIGGDGLGSVYFDDASFRAVVGPPVTFQVGTNYHTGSDDTTNAIYSMTDGDLASVSGGNPFRMIVAAYDADSGLARTNVAGAEGSNTVVSLLHLATNNAANYNAAESSPSPLTSTSTNIWRWDAISTASIDAMYGAGSNAIRATLRDADFDRTADQMGVTNSLLGYVKLADDDGAAPVFSGFRPTLSAPPSPGVSLSAGDIAIIGYDSAAPEGLSFVTLASVPSGTVVKFTDAGWLAAGGFRAGEGTLVWSNTAPDTLRFGTKVTITNGSAGVGNQGASTGTVVKVGSYDLAATDQLIAYQEGPGVTTTLFAVNWNGGSWQGDATDSSSSALPAGLTNGSTALALSSVASNVYTMTTSSATKGLLLSAIANPANWTRVGLVLPPAGTFSEYAQISDGNLVNGSWWIAGYVQDAGSGVNSNNVALGPDIGVNYDLWSPSNVAIFSDTMFQLQQWDGGGRLWPTSIASGVASVPALQNTLGTWTVRVSAADNDDDRTGDRSVAIDNDVMSFQVIDDDTNEPAVLNLLGENLLTNSGFEVAGWWSGIASAWDNTNGLILGSTFGNYFRTDFRSHGGGYAAAVPGQFGPNPNDWGGWFQGVTNRYGDNVVWRGSAWAFADPIWTGRCFIQIEFYQSDNSTKIGSATQQFPIPSNRWVYVSMLATSPVNTGFARLVLNADQMNTNVASLYFDDASLQVATNVTLPMDVQLGGVSYYREGAGITGAFQVTDRDLAQVAATNPLKFIFRVYDPSSGVARSKTEELFNYDLGTNGSDLTRNIYVTFSNSLSSADTTAGLASSVFAHAQNFTLGGYHSGTNFVETGDVFNLLLGITNVVTVSAPNADEDRGPNDREWFTDQPFGRFVVQDDDTNGPVPTLKFVGTNYAPGLVQSNVVTDGDLVNDRVSFAYEWVDASGLFVTNNNGATNNDANAGNLSMNWDLRSPSGVYVVTNLVHPATSVFSVAGNGSVYATVAQARVAQVVYDNNELGSWTILASGQDMDDDRGTISHLNQTVNWDRAISPDIPMSFTVIDDDDAHPVVETQNYSLAVGFVAYANGGPFGSGAGNGTQSNRVYTVTDEEMLGFATNPLRMVFNVWDAYSGIARGSNDASTSAHITVTGWVTNNVTNFNLSGSTPYTTNMASTSQWTHSHAFPLSQINAMMDTTGRVFISVPDADTDRQGDVLWRTNHQVGSIRWADDGNEPPQLRSFGSTNAALQLYVGGHPDLGFAGTNAWLKLASTNIVNDDQLFAVNDGDLARVSAGTPLDFNIWVYETENGVARDAAGPLSNSSLSVGSVIVSNVSGYVASNSSSLLQSKLPFNATSLWRFTAFSYGQVGSLYGAPGGSNRLTLHAANADMDRGQADQERGDTNMGWLVVSDDDSNRLTAANLTINSRVASNVIYDQEVSTGFLLQVRFWDDVAGAYTAAANGALSPPNFDILNPSSQLVQTNQAFTFVGEDTRLRNFGFEAAGTNSRLAAEWDEACYTQATAWVRSNGAGRGGSYALAMDTSWTSKYEVIGQWVDVSGVAVGETIVFGGWVRMSNALAADARTVVKIEWWDVATSSACPGGVIHGYTVGNYVTNTANLWFNTEVASVKPNASAAWARCFIEFNTSTGIVIDPKIAWDDMYFGSPSGVVARRAGVTVPYGNIELGDYAFRWTAQDSDNDRTNDTLGRVDATNMAYGWHLFNVQDDQPGSPTGLNLYCNGSAKELTNGIVRDQQIRNGQWLMSFRIIDPQGVTTSGIGPDWAPNYSLLNAGGVTVHANYGFTTLNPESTETNLNCFVTMNGVDFADVDTGLYSVVFSAQNNDNDRPGDRGGMTNFAGMGGGVGAHGAGHQFLVVDDDTNSPSIPTNIAVDVTWWTNVNLFNVTFNASTDEYSGIYQYRYDTNVAASAWVTNGEPVTALATSELAAAAFSNRNFESGASGQVITNYDAADRTVHTHGWNDFSSQSATVMLWNVAQSGTGATRHVVGLGAGAQYTLIGQEAYIENTNGYPVIVSMSAWFSGDVSRVGNGVTGTAFLKLEFFDAATTKVGEISNEYGGDHNGSPLFGVNCTGWSNVMITTSNGPASTRYIRFMMGIAQHGTALPYTGYWDHVVATVQVVGAVGNSYSFPMTNALEGIRTNWLFAVDDDNDRPDDRRKSINTNFITWFDGTPPAVVTNFTGTNGIDESSEVTLNWTALTNAGHRAGDGDPLSPWRTYYVFFTTNANVTLADPSVSFTNAGYGSLHTNTTATISITNLEFDSTYRFVIRGQDRAGNMGPPSRTVEVTTLSFIVTQGMVNAAAQVDLSWLAAPAKVYDVLWEDAMGYTDSMSNRWQTMLSRVTNSWVTDGGDVGRAAPSEMVNTLRFYRVSREGQWATNSVPRRASREIYVSKTWRLAPGENWISLPFLPETNRFRVKDVFGTNLLPRDAVIGNSTKISWYGHTLGTGTNSSGVATNVIWLSNANRWYFSLPPALAGQVADNWRVPSNEAFNIEIPKTVSTQSFVAVGRLPTNVMTRVIRGAVGETNYSVLTWGTPYRVKVKELGLLGASFSGGVNVTRSDELRIMDNSNGRGSMSMPKARIWRNGATTNFYFSPSGSIANDYYIEPGEAIIIVRKRAPSMVWTNKLYYLPPGKNINP